MVRTFSFTLLLAVTIIFSATQRLGIFIGNDNGLPGERPLKYASRDARVMAGIFKESGTFDNDRVYLLVNQPVNNIRDALKEIAGRIKELKNDNVMLLAYYSGHGSGDALHINGQALKQQEITKYLDDVTANLKIFIIDACESGSLLRTKGGVVVEDHNIQKVDSLLHKGTIILSSSSRGELAQESEGYKGAVFSHHLINGLQGIADYNHDREISLWEAFQYARVSTQMESIHGKVNQQNPSFDMDVVGGSDIILTTMYKKRSRLLMRGFPPSALEFHNAGNMDLVSRIHLPGRDSVLFSLPSREYLITCEANGKFKAAKVDMTWNQVTELTPASFRSLPKSYVYRKGGRAINLNPHAGRLGVIYTEPASGLSARIYNVSYAFRSFNYKLTLNAGYGQGSALSTRSQINHKIFRLSYHASMPFFRYPYGQALAGAELGFNRVWQSLRDRRFDEVGNPDINAYPSVTELTGNVYELSFPLEKELYLPFGFIASLAWRTSIYGSKNYSTGGMQYNLRFRPGAGIGYKF